MLSTAIAAVAALSKRERCKRIYCGSEAFVLAELTTAVSFLAIRNAIVSVRFPCC
jgi:hypothetical protein